ncbi:Kelch-like protein 30 [Colletotrichum asianum]
MESFEDNKSKGSAPTSTNSEDAPDFKFEINCEEAWTFLVETSDTSPGPGQVFLIAEDKKFSVRENILIKHSKYFERSLRNPRYVESQTKTFTFDDIKAVHLGVYLHLVYCQVFGQSADIPSFGEPERCIWFPGHVEIYQLCDRFLNKDLAVAVSEGLQCYLILDPSVWYDSFVSEDYETFSSFYIRSLSQCFKLLDQSSDTDRHLRRAIVYSLCHCMPIAISQECLKLIQGNHELLFEVASCYAGMLQEARKDMRSTEKPKQWVYRGKWVQER